MNSWQLKDILAKHKAWLNGEKDGVRADLSDANLSDANLRGADLSDTDLRSADLSDANLNFANLRGADLSDTDLRSADLRSADLRSADLRSADLSDANLRYANLSDANLRGADLRHADLRHANLRGANLNDANLNDANLNDANLNDANLNSVKCNEYTCGYFLACPKIGYFIGFKKASDFIVVLEIPADAQRSSATSLKCRCDKAIVLRIENLDGSISDLTSIPSNYDKNFIYKVGETVCVDDFDTDRWNECSRGIHFFLSRALAVQY